MRKLLMILALLATTPALAQVANWWGGSSSGTGYPNQSTPITNSATGTTAAISVTLPGVAGKTTFLCGFALTSGGTTAALTVDATVAGTITGTLNFAYVFVSTGQGAFGVSFHACIPANAMSTAIVVSLPAGGAGTTAAVSAWGYQL